MGNPPSDDTKVCPFCAETIKRAAVVCRYCGRELAPMPQAAPQAAAQGFSLTPDKPKKYSNNTGCIIASVVIVVVFLAFMVNAVENSGAQPTASPPTSRAIQTQTPTSAESAPALRLNTPTSAPTPVPAVAAFLGDIVELDGYSLSVVVIEDPSTRPGIFYQPEAGEKLVAVQFIVGNVSGEVFSSNVLYAILVDAGGLLYRSESSIVEGSLELLEVSPGEKVQGWAGFVIPENATPVAMKYEINGGRVTLTTSLIKRP